jgi:uncharacterized protein YggE
VEAYDNALRQFTVSGSAQLNIAPDCADLTMTISATSPKSTVAAATTRERQDKMLTALAAIGVEASAVKMSSATLAPVFDHDKNGVIINRRFKSDINVTIETKDFSKIAAIMEAASAAGVGQITTSFRRSDIVELKTKVRDMALLAAKAKAKQMATALEFKLGPVVGVNENPAGQIWSGRYMSSSVNVINNDGFAPQEAADVSILGVQSQQLQMDVSVSYELVRPVATAS